MNKLMLVMNKMFASFTRLAEDGVGNGSTEITSLQDLANAFRKIMNKIIGPVLTVIGVAAVIYAIMLGIQYAKAEDADGRKKVQGRLIGAVVGAVIIIAGIVVCFAVKWDQVYLGFVIE
ncbi:MAG: hypothetical protein E7345_03885 [Clostridiales bacterium]|nr:hypothetical protein [Clostridiales bacterium]